MLSSERARSLELAPARRGRRAGGGRSVARDFAPPRAGLGATRLDELLEALEVPFDRRSGAPRASPTFSLTPSGTKSIWTITRVVSSSSLWKVTTPALSLPSVLRHATRSSGLCSVISASHSCSVRRSWPSSAGACRRSGGPRRRPSMNFGELLELGPLVVDGADRGLDID